MSIFSVEREPDKQLVPSLCAPQPDTLQWRLSEVSQATDISCREGTTVGCVEKPWGWGGAGAWWATAEGPQEEVWAHQRSKSSLLAV